MPKRNINNSYYNITIYVKLKFKNDEKANDDYRHDGGYNECKCTV